MRIKKFLSKGIAGCFNALALSLVCKKAVSKMFENVSGVWGLYIEANVIGFTYNGKEYYYVKNALNDIIRIVDGNGDIVWKNIRIWTYISWWIR